MTTQKYANDLRKVIDFNRYVRLVASLGGLLDSPKDRFDKSDIIEQCIDVYSNSRLKWINQEGRDHYDTKLKLDTEFKYEKNCLFTAKRLQPKKIVTIKVKNNLGSHKGNTIVNPAAYYMFAQQNAISVISFEELKPYLVAVSDGIQAQVPFDKLTMIFTPADVKEIITVDVDYKAIKAAAQRKLIESIS